jgi:hypothetical protein
MVARASLHKSSGKVLTHSDLFIPKYKQFFEAFSVVSLVVYIKYFNLGFCVLFFVMLD